MCGPEEKILVFDRYNFVSAKDHERQRRAGVGSTTFNLERQVVRIITDDSDILVLLVFSLDEALCSQLLGAHALSGYGTVSFHFGKGTISALKILSAGNFPGLFNVLGEEGATQGDLMEVGKQFFTALYGHPGGTSMAQARYNMYSRKQWKPLHIKYLPLTDIHLYLHVRRVHLQMLLWKAVYQQGPPDVDILEYS